MDSIRTGQLIAELRKQKGMNQIELAEKLNISNRTVSKWENGDGFPDISLLPDIAALLGITTDELLSGELNEIKENEPDFPKFTFKGNTEYKDYLVLYKENMRHTMPLWFRVILVVCYSIIFVLFCQLPKQSLIPFTSAMLIVLVFILVFFPYLWALLAMSNRKQLAGKNDDKLECVIEVSDKLYLNYVNSTHTYGLDEITGFYIRKDYYIFRMNKKIYVSARKDCLIDADHAKFEAYMKSFVVNKGMPVWRKALHIITAVLLILVTLVMIGVSTYLLKSDTVQYSNMSISEIVELDDEKIYDIVSERVYGKIEYQDDAFTDLSKLNESELIFYYVDVAQWNGDIIEYLTEYNDYAVHLYDALTKTGLTEPAELYQNFIDKYNIKYDDIDNSLKPITKGEFDAFDQSMAEAMKSDKVEKALAEFVKQNQSDFE